MESGTHLIDLRSLSTSPSFTATIRANFNWIHQHASIRFCSGRVMFLLCLCFYYVFMFLLCFNVFIMYFVTNYLLTANKVPLFHRDELDILFERSEKTNSSRVHRGEMKVLFLF